MNVKQLSGLSYGGRSLHRPNPELTRDQFVAMLKRRKLFFVYPDDDGVWHGCDFLYPGDTIGKHVDHLPTDAKICQGCFICYHSKPGEL